jgi:hypothetical protein
VSTSLISRFLEVCPGFKPRWEEHLADRDDEPAGDYNDMRELAAFIVDRQSRDDTSFLPAIFSLIESILEGSNAEEKKIMTVGLLESIQIQSTHLEFGPDAFVPYLGPHSRAAWASIARAWEGKDTMMDVLRAETEQHESPET